MSWLVRGLGTTLGLKFLMGLTGLVLFLFTIGHMAGNLQVFAGPATLNAYAAALQALGPVLWAVRIGLLLCLVVHVGCAAKLTRINRAARPAAYALSRPIQSTYASRTMMMTGVLLLVFVVYHLLHFTIGVTHPADFDRHDAQGRHDVWAMVMIGFRRPEVSIAYVVFMLVLGLHLWHGAQSFFQSLGWNHRRYKRLLGGTSQAVAALVVIGNIVMPLAILLGVYDGGGLAP